MTALPSLIMRRNLALGNMRLMGVIASRLKGSLSHSISSLFLFEMVVFSLTKIERMYWRVTSSKSLNKIINNCNCNGFHLKFLSYWFLFFKNFLYSSSYTLLFSHRKNKTF